MALLMFEKSSNNLVTNKGENLVQIAMRYIHFKKSSFSLFRMRPLSELVARMLLMAIGASLDLLSSLQVKKRITRFKIMDKQPPLTHNWFH